MGALGISCWCGNERLAPYSDEYERCHVCESLVSRLPRAEAAVRDETRDLYGFSYFVEHARELGHPDLFERTRRDLSERCVYWLKALLRYRPPPARTLEIGCGNGTFVATLASAGYDASGLDLSPALTEHVRATFDVPVLTGRVEDQRLEPRSIDVLVLMDVLEHLPDPLATLASVGPALAEDALLLIQTPRFDPALSYAQLVEREDAFLQQIKPREHLFLLSEGSARELLSRAGYPCVRFEPALFSQYDMFLVASRRPIAIAGDWREALRRSRSGRIMEALVDAYDEACAARAARVEQVREHETQLQALEQARAAAAGLAREQAVELERLREVERAHSELVRRLGPLGRLFHANSPPKAAPPGGKR